MTARQRTVVIVCLAGSIIAGAVYFALWGSGVATNPEALLLRLPTQDAVVAGIDFDALRASGILASLLETKIPQEAEYVDFIRETGFDYQRDLRYVLASFAADGEFFLIRGRFDWRKLQQYVAEHKGSCVKHVCHLSGSTPDKKISFFPMTSDLMAMAVAPDEAAAERLNQLGPQADMIVPREPVWLTFSAGALRHSASLPGSSRLFATAILDAERVTITAGLSSSDRIEARLEAVCRDAQQAGALTVQLQTLTNLLRSSARDAGETISPDDLGGMLTSGTFWQAGSHVMGHWPIPRKFLANLTK